MPDEKSRRTVLIMKECRDCQVVLAPIEVTAEQAMQLEMPRSERPMIQDILPDHPKEIRELFISGICPDCWDRIFWDRIFSLRFNKEV